MACIDREPSCTLCIWAGPLVSSTFLLPWQTGHPIRKFRLFGMRAITATQGTVLGSAREPLEPLGPLEPLEPTGRALYVPMKHDLGLSNEACHDKEKRLGAKGFSRAG